MPNFLYKVMWQCTSSVSNTESRCWHTSKYSILAIQYSALVSTKDEMAWLKVLLDCGIKGRGKKTKKRKARKKKN